MSRFKRIKDKSNKKSSVSIDEKIAALNKELKKTGILKEIAPTNSTAGVYSSSTHVPADPGGSFPVPDTSGVTGDGFNQPVSGNPDDPSNWPDAYANDDWLFNPNDVNGETDRPIVRSLDKGLIDSFNTAFPDNGKYPSGGGGVVFGNLAFGTAVGYARNGHFIQVLNPGLHGNGSVNVAPRFESPYFGLFGYYFPIAGDEEANLIIGMSKLWMSLGYTTEASKVHQLQLWTPHNNFHDGAYADWSGKKYTDSETGRRYVLKTFYMHRAGNTYDVTPTPAFTKNPIIRGTEDEPIYPGPIANSLGLGARAFEWLFGRAKGAPTSPTSPEDPETTETKKGEAEKEEDEEEKRRLERLKNLAQMYDNSIMSDIKYAAVVVGGIAVWSMAQYVTALIAAGYTSYQIQKLLNEAVATVNSTVDTFDQQDITDIGNIQTSILKIEGELVSDEKVGGMSDAEWDDLRAKQNDKENDALKRVTDKLQKAQNGGRKKVEKAAEKALKKLRDIKAKNKARRQQITKLRKQAQKLADEAKAAYREMERLGIKNVKDAPPHLREKIQNLSRALSRNNIRGEVNRQYLKRHFPKGPGGEFGSTLDITSTGGGGSNLNMDYQPQGDVLSEGVALGHFEPEELNVDIEDLRKGIMPEYPKQPPAKMIDGYHEKSRIKSKEVKNIIPTLKIDKTDLIRNHKLSSSEVDEMMNTINMINDHIKKHPEDWIHAQMRYPVDDPRLAELNWKMDQMLDAGEEYLDSNFKVNDKLFKRAVDRTKNNIKLTDPEYVQQNYNELRGTTQGKVINPKPRDIKLKSKLKKHLPQYESKSFFRHVDSKDFKKISERKEEQKRLKLENETALNKLTKERQEYIDGEMLKQKSDWRKEISESDFTNITTGNKVSQTFQHTTGATITLDGALGGVESIPKTVTLDFGLDGKLSVDAPTESQYGLAGFAKPLDLKIQKKIADQSVSQINDRLDASKEASGAETAKVVDLGLLDDLGYKSAEDILAEVGDVWTYEEYMEMMNAIGDRAAAKEDPIVKKILEYSPTGKNPGKVPMSLINAQEAITIAAHKAMDALARAWELYNKIPEPQGGFGGGQGNPTNKRGSGFPKKDAQDSSGYGMDPSRDTETEARPVDDGDEPDKQKISRTKNRRSNYTPQEIAQNRENLKNSIITTATGVIDGARNLNRVNYALNLAKRQSVKSGGSTRIKTIPANSLGGRNNPVETKMHFQSKKAFIKSVDLNNTDYDIASQIVNNSADAAQYALGFKAVHSQIPTEGGSQENNVKLNSKGDLEMFDNYAFRPDGYENFEVPVPIVGLIPGVPKIPVGKIAGKVDDKLGTEFQKDLATQIDKAGPVGWLSHALLGDIPDRQDPSVRIKTTITKKELIKILGAADYKIFVNRMKKEKKKRKVNESNTFSKIKEFRNKY